MFLEYAPYVWEGSTHTALLNRVESKAFHLISPPPLTDCLPPFRFRRSVAPFLNSINIFMLPVDLNLPPVCHHPYHDPFAQNFSTIPNLYAAEIHNARNNQHPYSFILLLVNSATAFLFCISSFLRLESFQEGRTKALYNLL